MQLTQKIIYNQGKDNNKYTYLLYSATAGSYLQTNSYL